MFVFDVLSGIAGALTAHVTEILTTLAFITFGTYLCLQYQYTYWRRHRVPYIEPAMIFGNFKGILKSECDSCAWFQYLYQHEKAKDLPIIGIYCCNKPALLVRDLELVKRVLIKDNNYFSNRHASADPHFDSMGSDNLFFAKNPVWKELRAKLSPVFSSGRMKQMFPLMQEMAQQYDSYLCTLKIDSETKSTVLEIKESNSLYTTDVIAITAYGVKSNSLQNPNGTFRKNGKKIFTFSWFRSLEFKAIFFIPILTTIFHVKVFSASVTKFLRKTINNVMEERIKSGIVRNDLIDILIKLRREAEVELKEGKKPFLLQRDALAAQAAIFFSAGFETSSMTLSFTMYEMARHPDMQRRLREEIREAVLNNDGKVTYELIMGLKYLDNILKEVLRIYPPLPFLDRTCTPKAGEAGYSLNEYGIDFNIPLGMPIFVPSHAMHMDPQYFKDPEKFYPDRFLPENKEDNNLSAYMPFGLGPHTCLGERFALLQTKVGLLYFYRNHYVTPCDQTPREIELSPSAVILHVLGGIHLNIVRDPLFYSKSTANTAMWTRTKRFSIVHDSATNAMWLESLLLLLLLCCLLLLWLRYHYDYWNRHQVPQLRPTYGVGLLGGLFSMQRSPAEFVQSLYNHPDARHRPFVGVHVFNEPAILLREPELIKRILVKDFSKFSDRFSNSDCKGDPLGSLNLFFLRNPAWKEVRFKLSPFFTSGKLKHMLPLVEEVGRELDKYLLSRSIECHAANSFTMEMKELCALYTTDVIATVAYGVQANCFKNPNGEFRRHGRAVFKFSVRRSLEFMVVFFMPHLVPYLKFKVVPPTSSEFLRSTINYVMEQRELSGLKRNDLIDILIEFKNSTKNKNSPHGLIFEGDILVAQAALFFTAGFESSSATMSFALYELAKQPDLQQRVREEISEGLTRTAGKISHEFIDSLQYMQMVIDEVLRLYPPLPFLDRQCTEQEGYSLEPFHNFRMPQGMPVYIPVYGLHMNPEFYPEPEKFDPERFAPQNKKNLKPYAYMPFGLGPHGCIGERFAMMQTKIGLTYFLLNHKVTTCERTKIPMQLDRKAVVVQAEGGIYLNVVRSPLINCRRLFG
ncbi:uncharacterized protein LOC129244309 [Anastrepha obliqua]|uniref:uncharacterized protein LOC129244309 n=1 Tax=Anastrepha obliqua TaxID=95512 RepID=UPI002409B6C7|nr:uncharacterized protein LOC129244309 [Anastrepha obliqua]